MKTQTTAASDWLDASKGDIRNEFKKRLPIAPRFGDADDGDQFTDGDYLTIFGYKQGLVVYCIRKRNMDADATLQPGEIQSFLDRSRSGGTWKEIAIADEPHNPDRTWAHQQKEGTTTVDTGAYAKTGYKRQRIISFTGRWNGNPDSAIHHSLLALPLEEMITKLKK